MVPSMSATDVHLTGIDILDPTVDLKTSLAYCVSRFAERQSNSYFSIPKNIYSKYCVLHRHHDGQARLTFGHRR